jgi:hypothetical protein
MAYMKDPEIAAIKRAMSDDPKIEPLLAILTGFVRIGGEDAGTQKQAGAAPDPGRLSEGFPLADARLIPDDVERLGKRFARLVSVVLEKDPKGAEEIVGFYGDRQAFRALLSGVLTQEYLFPEGFGGSRPVALLAANETLRYLLNPVKENAERAGFLDKWAASYCPVCGAAPHLSLIEGEDGSLSLSCGRCLTRWKFRRLTCPFCGETGREKTRYFTVENDPVHRVYVCDTCKHYLKSVDSKERPTPFARLEDLTTVRFDIVAKREGYIRDTVDLVSVLVMDT